MSLDKKKEQLNESFIDFTNDQIRALEATKTDYEFDMLMYDYVEDHNYKHFIREGASEKDARMMAKKNRKQAGG